MQKSILAVITLSILSVGLVSASDDAHQHKAPHGGIVRTAGDYHLELVRDETGYKVYLLDTKEKTLPVTDLSGKATCMTKDKKKTEVDLMVAGDHLVFGTDPDALEGGTVIVTIRKGSESISAKFNPKAHDDHGHDKPHDHH